MSQVKYAVSGISTAAGVLFLQVLASMGIIYAVQVATGWKMPTWLAWVLVGCVVAAAVVGIIASCGVTIPMWLGITVASLGGTAA